MTDSNKILQKILLFIICAIPSGLVSGPFLPDLFVVISGLIIIYICYSKKIWFIFNNNFCKFFLAFYIYLLFNSIFSYDPSYSFKHSVFFIRFLFFVVAIKYIIEKEEKFYFYFFFSTLFLLILLFFDSTIEFFLNKHWLFDKTLYPEFHNSSRISGLFDEEYILGSFFVRLYSIMMALFFFLYNKTLNEFKKPKFYFFIFLYYLLFLIPILYSGERLSLFIFIFINILIVLRYNHLFKSFFLILFSFLFVIFVVFNTKSFNERFIKNTYLLFSGNLGPNDNSQNLNSHNKKNLKIFSIEHQAHISIAYSMFLDKPILGHGFKTFRKICDTPKYYLGDRSCTTHPHNTPSLFLSELGLIGFIFYMLAYIYILYKLFASIFIRKSRNFYDQIFLSGFCLYLFPLSPAGNFFNNWMEIIFFLPVGFYLSRNQFYK